MKSKNTPLTGSQFSAVAVIVIGGLAGGDARAADGNWNVFVGGGSRPWTTAGNWVDSVIPGESSGTTSPDIATFNGAVTTSNRIVTVDATRNIGGITFGGNNTNLSFALNSGGLVLSAGGVIKLDATATSGSHSENVNATVTLAGDATFTNNATGSNRSLKIQTVNGSAATGNTGILTINGSNNSNSNVVTQPTGGQSIGDGANGGQLALIKSGTGKWTLSGNSTYTGATTVSAGTLLVTGALANTAVSVEATATIGGTGTLGGSLAFDGESTFNVLNLADALTVSGVVTFGSGFGIDNLTGVNWDAVDLNTPYTLLDNGTDFSAAGLDNFGLANAVSVGVVGRLAYFETGSLQVVVIPEPNAAILLGGLGVLGLLRRRRGA